MNEYTCTTVDELLAGYAADAIEEDERRSVADHLAECRNHDEALTAIRAGLDRLAVVVPPVVPSPSLRSNLLAAFDREVAGVQAAPAVSPAQATAHPEAREGPVHPEAREGRPEVRPARRGGFFSIPNFGYALAAALLVVAAGLGVWGASRGGDDTGVVVRTATQDGNSIRVTYVESEQLAVLDVELGPLPEGRTYQAWQMVGGSPVSLGVLPVETGRVAFSTDLTDAAAIALSIEPEGGSQTPTTDPFLIAEL